ncbi:uncharacterized protein LOC143868183 [Tasmannia lanceolata]|uniref:uncharacterized protein LOC143868183 n=1 Tax=Tasmannia lanceolata TaxID=3420 RepID=UPI00406402AB
MSAEYYTAPKQGIIEKFAFAVVVAARKLNPYFQAHTVVVLTDQPLRKILQKPDTSGRLINWAVELRKFDIQVRPHPIIKSQVLADFVVECMAPTEDFARQEEIKDEQEKQYPWMLFVDGSVNAGRRGAGLVLAGPDKFLVEYALKLDFNAFNNEAEYEALLAGLALALELEAD